MVESESTDRVTPFQRWLGFVPILVSFVIMGIAVPRGQIMREYFRMLRIDLPLPTVLAISWSTYGSKLYFIWIPSMFAISWLYFAWGAKNRDRLQVVNILATCCCLFTALILIAGFFLPFIRIQETLISK